MYTSKNSSSPLLSSFATGLTSSRASNSIVAMDAVSDDSDDEDVEYKGHFCLGCSIPPPGGVHGWVRGYGGTGLWEAGPGCVCCEDHDYERFELGFLFFCFCFCFFDPRGSNN